MKMSSAPHPSRLRCFVNREEFDFGSLNDVAATQEFPGVSGGKFYVVVV